MLIDRGATVIPIIAISTQSNGCVSLSSEPSPFINTITWAALYYSLRLQGAIPSNHLRQQIVGRWENFGILGTVAPGGGWVWHASWRGIRIEWTLQHSDACSKGGDGANVGFVQRGRSLRRRRRQAGNLPRRGDLARGPLDSHRRRL